MSNYYELLQVARDASTKEIKKAFRERAKQLHPDIRGEKSSGEMRKLLAAYETLVDNNRRFEYDRAYARFAEKYYENFRGKHGFDYRTFLREKKDDPESQAKLIFFELLHLEEDEAISIWQRQGGLGSPFKKYLDREDWMDCTFILAEELAKRERYYEAFVLLISLVREERQRPYFKHFMEEVEKFLKEIVRLHLRRSVDAETYLDCMEALFDLGFSAGDKRRWERSMAQVRRTLYA